MSQSFGTSGIGSGQQGKSGHSDAGKPRTVPFSSGKSMEPDAGEHGSLESSLPPVSESSVRAERKAARREVVETRQAQRHQKRHEKQRVARKTERIVEALTKSKQVAEAVALPETTYLPIIKVLRDDAHAQKMKGRLSYADDHVFNTYRALNRPGIVYIMDDTSGEVVLVVRCTNAKDMSSAEQGDFKRLFLHLHEDSKLHNPVPNGKLKTGLMYALGWRGGYDAAETCSPYKYKHEGSSERDRARQATWARLRAEDSWVHEFYGKRFQGMAPRFQQESQIHNEEHGLPYFGHDFKTDAAEHTHLFASNLTYTTSDRNGQTFHNVGHEDEDSSPSTYGIWGLADTNGNWVSQPSSSDTTNQPPLINGFFYVASYRLKIMFEAQPYAIWEIIWRGSTDVHATVEGKMRKGLNWFGTSAQTTRALKNKILNARKKGELKVPADGAYK